MSGTRRHTLPQALSLPGHTGIAAQDLLKLPSPPRKSGFLRKKGKKEKLAHSIGLGNFLKWSHRFVVIANSNVYCYPSELAKSPSSTVSLVGYNKVQRESDKNCWCFVVKPAFQNLRTLTFACASDVDRKAWMTAFRQEMLLANRVDENWSNGSYNDIEAPVFEVENEEPEAPDLKYDETTPSFSDSSADEFSDEDNPYDEINETFVDSAPRPKPKPRSFSEHSPAVPSHVQTRYRSVPAPAPAPAPKPHQPTDRGYLNDPVGKGRPQGLKVQASLEEECTTDEMDRDKIISILTNTNVTGTFLLRRSRQDDSKVLAVLGDDKVVKEFKIFRDTSGMTLNRTHYFPNVDKLLDFYMRNILPNKTFCLKNHVVGSRR